MQTPSFGEKASKKCDPCLHIFFLSFIVYIFKNVSQIFADMSACLSDNQHVMSGHKKLHLEIKPTSINIFPHSLIKTMVNDTMENAISKNMEWKKMLKKLNISHNQDDLKMLLTNFGELEKRYSKGNIYIH